MAVLTILDKITLVERNTAEFINQINGIGNNQNLGLVKFILVCCLIDATSAYGYPRVKNNVQYKSFIKKYLGQVDNVYLDQSVANKLYHGIRCGLVHAFTIPKGILLTEANNRKVHLKVNDCGDLIVDLVTFYEDLKKAIRLFFKDVKAAKGDIHKQFKKAFRDNPPFEIYKNVNLLNPDQPASGVTTNTSTTSYQIINFGRKRL